MQVMTLSAWAVGATRATLTNEGFLATDGTRFSIPSMPTDDLVGKTFIFMDVGLHSLTHVDWEKRCLGFEFSRNGIPQTFHLARADEWLRAIFDLPTITFWGVEYFELNDSDYALAKLGYDERPNSIMGATVIDSKGMSVFDGRGFLKARIGSI